MKSLTYVIPLYNEEKGIKDTIKSLLESPSFNTLNLEEVIFVNDGSTDTTQNILRYYENTLGKSLNARITIISYDKSKGMGYAIKTGILSSTTDYTVILNPGLCIPLDQLSRLSSYMEDGAPVIVGTRKDTLFSFKEGSFFVQKFLETCSIILTRFMLNTWVGYFDCDFKAFSRDARNRIFTRTLLKKYAYNAEIFFIARKLGYFIAENEVYWSIKTKSKVNALKDALLTFRDLIRIRVNYMLKRYDIPVESSAISYKVAGVN